MTFPKLFNVPAGSQLRGWLPVGLSAVFLIVMISAASSITTRTQISVAVVAMVAFLILRYFNEQETVRVVFLILATFLSVDYFYWRTFTTLTYHDPLSFLFAMLLYFAELYGFIVYLLSIFVNVDPLERKPLPLPKDEDLLPTVDVMIPTYNEEPDLLEVTLLSALDMEYPKSKMKVYLLDDGGTDQRCKSEDPEFAAPAGEPTTSPATKTSGPRPETSTTACSSATESWW